MEILTVKNNKIDYLTLKKVVFYTFPTYYILSLVAMFCGALIALFINLLWNDDCQVEISHFFDYRLFVFFCVILIKDIGQETSIQIYRRLATLLFVDWLPQVNGFAASFFVYSRESNLWNKKCLHRIILNNFNHLLIEISCPIASILFLLLSIYFNNDNLKFYLISLNPSIINYINQYDLS